MTYSRNLVRNYFSSMTSDSRPCKPGECPIQTAFGLPFPSDATRLDADLAWTVDEYCKAHGLVSRCGGPTWDLLTAGEIVKIIEDLIRKTDLLHLGHIS